MKNRLFCQILACVYGWMLLMTATSCEKMVVNDETSANVVVHVRSYEQIPFPAKTRAEGGSSISKLCFHIYNDEGERVAYVNQKTDDDHFGSAYFTLEKGHYYVLVVGHNASSNPSFNKNERVSISGKDLGDTFWRMKEIEVDEDNIEESVELERIVSRINFIPTDDAPEEMNQMIFSYKGSKGTFDGLTGYGSTNVNQTVVQDVNADDKSFGFYMIPSADEENIDLEIKTYNVDERGLPNSLTSKTIKGVPVQRNRITICKGVLFSEKSSDQSIEFTIVINDTWGPDIEFNF